MAAKRFSAIFRQIMSVMVNTAEQSYSDIDLRATLIYNSLITTTTIHTHTYIAHQHGQKNETHIFSSLYTGTDLKAISGRDSNISQHV